MNGESKIHDVCSCLILAAILSTAGLMLSCGEPGPQKQDSAFVSEKTCASCHPNETKLWQDSHHDLAMQEASEETVLGDFNDVSFSYHDVTARFFRKGAGFFVNTEGPDGVPTDYQIKYTFGIEPLQQYLIEFPGGRLQCLTVAWDRENETWFSLYPNQEISPDDPLHWTGLYQTWNNMCADCHSTNYQKNYEPNAQLYRSAWDLIDVGCQSCHGAGREHLSWANEKRDPAESSSEKGLVWNLKKHPQKQIDACAPCHARRTRISAEAWQGKPFTETFLPALLREGLYHADGQILDEVYVYGSFLQSKMFRSGVYCSDCHNPHSLQLAAQGNDLCTRCHQQIPETEERFSTLITKNYDTAEHHFHQPGSEGASCVNCHMPSRNYMVIDPRRDHSFRVPRPDLSVEIGTPNACTMCHDDQTDEWAAAWVERWYPNLNDSPEQFAEAFAAGRAGAQEAVPGLIALLEKDDVPAIRKATAVDLLRSYGDPEVQEALIAATRADDPLVRAAAVGGLERLPDATRLPVVAPLLSDPARIVRMGAAPVLASLPSDQFTEEQRRAFQAALAEFRHAQWLNADQPSSYLNLGVLYTNQGRADSAEFAYRQAIALDPFFLPARFNLANLYNAMGRNRDAEVVLHAGINRIPKEGELHYSLGLILAEENRMEESADALAEASRLMPERSRVRYNYGLALQKIGRIREAETQFIKAHTTDQLDPSIVNALVILYSEQNDWERAYEFATKLVALAPDDPAAQRLSREIQARMARSAH